MVMSVFIKFYHIIQQAFMTDVVDIVFSSSELKARVSFSDCLLSVICLSFCLSVCKLFIFSTSSPCSTTGPIPTKLGTKHPWVEGIQVCSNEGSRPFLRGDMSENVKLYWKYLKIFFSRTTGLISTKLVTIKASLDEGDSILCKCRATPFSKGR